MDRFSWPATEAELVSAQERVAQAAGAALAGAPWTLPPDPLIGGCFVAFSAVVLAASTEGARAPVPLQEARRAAREARDLAGAG